MRTMGLVVTLFALVVALPACSSDGDDSSPPDAAPEIDADPTAPDAGLAAFGEECMENEDCESGLCFPFNNRGPHCTIPCDSPEDCPDPAFGCNGMGVCKVQ
jgi:hypothetical protein